MRDIFLIGFMGAGKSTVGRMLAGRLGMPFIDLDEVIELEEGASIRELFATRGEEGFRAAEQAALASVARQGPSVVACGGGIVLRDENRRMLKSSGTVVYLAVSPEEAIARVGDAADRPLLAGDARSLVPRILQARLSLYRATADITVDTTDRTPEDVVREVEHLLAERQVTTVRVGTAPPYEVLIGLGAMRCVGTWIASRVDPRLVAVVTDGNVAARHLPTALDALTHAGLEAHVLTVAPGESSKTWVLAGELLEGLARAGLGRDGCVLALGGGVVGDLAGFVAGVYMRGVPVVHVPTTLLAQVDSSIGGKTGVDLAAGKNLAGVFWQPALVVSDTSALDTLPEAEWSNGLAEVAKTALLAGEHVFSGMLEDAPRIIARQRDAVERMVETCVRFKASVVSRDTTESNVRECLNLGHTLGHAIEAVTGYRTVSHGVAVAEGMRFAAMLGERLGVSDAGVAQAVEELLQALELPGVDRVVLDADELLDAMTRDKKVRRGEVRFVLLERIGSWVVVPVGRDELAAALRAWCAPEGG